MLCLHKCLINLIIVIFILKIIINQYSLLANILFIDINLLFIINFKLNLLFLNCIFIVALLIIIPHY